MNVQLLMLIVSMFLVSCTLETRVIDSTRYLELSNASYVNKVNQTSYLASGECDTNFKSIELQAGELTFPVSCNDGKFSASLDLSSLPDSTYEIKVAGVNRVQEKYYKSVTVVKDTVEPTLTLPDLTSARSNTADEDAVITLQGVDSDSGIDHYDYTVYAGSSCSGVEVQSGVSQTSSLKITLPPGPYTLKSRAMDKAGNYSAYACSAKLIQAGLEKVKGTQFSFEPGYMALGNKVLFSANDIDHGYELWISDGTQAGTYMLKDLHVGTVGSQPFGYYLLGSTVYFFTLEGTGFNLWKTDGTSAGTVLVYDFSAGQDIMPNSMFSIGTNIYFETMDTSMTFGFVSSNGTTAGTTFTTPSSMGGSTFYSQVIPSAVTSSSKYIFTGMIAAGYYEPFTFNGTTVALLKDINPTGFSIPSGYANLNGKIYFSATASVAQGTELWGTDGTTAGTALVKDIDATSSVGSHPTGLTAFNNLLFFRATTLAGGYELYRTDGSSAGTVLVSDINSGAASSAPHDLYAYTSSTPSENRLFLGADNGTSGDELYAVNTSNVLALVKDINPGSGSSNPHSFFTFNNKAYFVADDGVHGMELWVTDGTSGGTTLVYDFCAGVCSSHVAYMGSLPNTALLQAFNGTQTRTYFLTASGVQEFQDTAIKYPDMSPTIETSQGEVNGKILITLGDNSRVDLAAMDPQTLNFSVLKRFSNISGLHGDRAVVFGQKLLFSANSVGGVTGLYISDGTQAGTLLLKEGFSSIPSNFMVMDTKIYFLAGTDATGVELWVTNGTAAGTSMVKDSYAGPTDGMSSPGSYNNFGQLDASRFILRGNNGTNGVEVFISDGTSAGTTMLKDIYTGGINSSYPGNFVALNSKVYFNAQDSVGSKIWVTNGSAAGTLAMTLPAAITNLVPWRATPTFFYAIGVSSTIGNELWRSDGTVAGTTLIKDINPGAGSSVRSTMAFDMNYYSSSTGLFYFTADDGTTGEELWRSDGTAAGTFRLADISTGTGDTKFTDVTVELDGKIYFNVQSDVNGVLDHAYYVSDGTVAGTKKIIFSKQNYSYPTGNVSISVTMKSMFVLLADAADVTNFFRFILE